MIIGISGRIGSGKDTAGELIQTLTKKSLPGMYNTFRNSWEIKKFASPLKKIVSLLTGCSLSNLESQSFKESEIGDDWKVWKVDRVLKTHLNVLDIIDTQLFSTYEEAEIFMINWGVECYVTEHNMTYRDMLQIIGTEAMRNKVHPNIWINALFSTYTTKSKNWVITDLRFPNEFNEIKKRDGINIKIERQSDIGSMHISEIALDNFTFDHVIDNNSTLEVLERKIREILHSYKIF